MSDNLMRRLREPPFGTESSERNLMNAAADRIGELECEIARLRGAVKSLEASEDDLADALRTHEEYRWLSGWRVNPFKPSKVLAAYNARRGKA